MFYEEKIINGVLMYRTTPDGDWQQCSIEKMGQRIVELQAEVAGINNAFDSAVRKATERGYLDGKAYEKDRMKEMLGLGS